MGIGYQAEDMIGSCGIKPNSRAFPIAVVRLLVPSRLYAPESKFRTVGAETPSIFAMDLVVLFG